MLESNGNFCLFFIQGYKIDEAEPLNLPGPSQRKFCEMEDVTSIGSVPNLGDVEDQDSLQVYDHYDFTPKENKLPIHSKRKEVSCQLTFVCICYLQHFNNNQ